MGPRLYGCTKSIACCSIFYIYPTGIYSNHCYHDYLELSIHARNILTSMCQRGHLQACDCTHLTHACQLQCDCTHLTHGTSFNDSHVWFSQAPHTNSCTLIRGYSACARKDRTAPIKVPASWLQVPTAESAVGKAHIRCSTLMLADHAKDV